MPWTLNGQALESQLFSGLVLTRRNLGANVLTWSQNVISPTSPEPRFSIGDAVLLELDSVAKFRATVRTVSTSTAEAGTTISYAASGAWFDLENLQLSGEQIDQGGTPAERLQFSLPSQPIGDSLAALVSRISALGIPLQIGSLAATFELPPITLSNQSAAAAFADLMRWLPDGILEVDDATVPPTLNLYRRPSAAPLNFTHGTPPLQSLRIAEEHDATPADIALDYLVRDETGRARFATQTSGQGGAQRVTISGEENADFLPLDLFDSADVQTVPRLSGADEIVCARSSSLQQFASCPGLSIADSVTFSNTQSGGSGASFFTRSFPAPVYALEDGSAAPASHGFALLSGSAPSFSHSADFLPVEISGFFITSIRERSAAQGGGFPDWPQWADETPGFDQFSGYRQVNQSFTEDLLTIWRVWQFSASTAVSLQAFADLTTIYRAADYGFIAPPAGMAAALASAKNFPKYSGDLAIVPEPGLPRFAPVSVAGICDRAIPSAIATNIGEDRHTIDLGPPEVLAYFDLAARFRPSGQDNIVPV